MTAISLENVHRQVVRVARETNRDLGHTGYDIHCDVCGQDTPATSTGAAFELSFRDGCLAMLAFCTRGEANAYHITHATDHACAVRLWNRPGAGERATKCEP